MFIPLILIIMIIVPIPILIKNMLSNRNAYRGILEGAIAAMAGVASLLMMFWILTGVSFFELINEGMNSVTLEDMKFAERYAMLGMEMPEPEELQLMLDYVKETMSLAVPGILILLCLVISYINYGIISWILSKSGQRITTLPPMRSFSLPKSIVIGSLLIYILAYLSASAGIIDEGLIMFNLRMLFSFFMVIQGIAVLFFFGYVKNIPKLVILFMVTILILIWIGQTILLVIGLADVIFDILKRIYHIKNNRLQ
jgi:uncharacterized protein YybS (DUF2232 family)